MKTQAAFIILLLAFAGAVAQAPPPEAPNMYQLSGGALQISYSSTSFSGQPNFSYKDAGQALSFKGGQIRREKTELGTLVSVTIRQTVDTGSTTFTILLPDVRLAGHAPATIHALGITTVHKFSPVPAANRGEAETYTTTELSGTASLAMF